MTNWKELRSLIERLNPAQTWIADNLLVMHKAGSHLYGTNTLNSDTDIRGVTCAPRKFWIGPQNFDQFEYNKDGLDIVIYDVRKWLKMVVNGNPNVIETAFVEQDSSSLLYASGKNPHHPRYDKQVSWWDIVRNARKLISRSAHGSFHGYATSQIRKMIEKRENKTGRVEIVARHGFDTKFVAHGFRIARQGLELLQAGKMTFPRPDAQDLLDIRHGRKYGANDLGKCLNDWEAEALLLDQAVATSVLPVNGDFAAYEQLQCNIFENLT